MAGVPDADAQTRLFTEVSRVRVEANSLLRALKALEEAISSRAPAAEAAVSGPTPQAAGKPEVTAKDARVAVLKAAVEAWDGARDTANLDEKRRALTDLLNGDADLYPYAEETWSVVNGISRLLDRWPDSFPEDAAWLGTAVKDSRAILREIVYFCGKITVPGDVEDELANLRVGKAFDFEAAFADTLRGKAQRKDVLTLLSNRRIGGWVDVAAGLIYKLPTTQLGQFASCVAPFLLALLAAGLMYLIPTFDLPSAWDLDDRWQLVGAFGLVLAGAVIHLLVENVKQLQTRSAPIVAITEGIYWFNLRWVGLSLTVLWALVVAVGLRVLGLESNTSDGATAYLAAGYSLDSVAGLILTRFDSAAGVWLRDVESEIGGEQGGGGAPDAGKTAGAGA